MDNHRNLVESKLVRSIAKLSGKNEIQLAFNCSEHANVRQTVITHLKTRSDHLVDGLVFFNKTPLKCRFRILKILLLFLPGDLKSIKLNNHISQLRCPQFLKVFAVEHLNNDHNTVSYF